MSSYIDTKFLNQLSNRLTNFKQKKPGLWNFRCPHCGDSEKSKSSLEDLCMRRRIIYSSNAITAVWVNL